MDLNYIYQLLQNGSQSKLIDYINFKEFEEEIAFNPTAQNAINILLEQMCTGEIESEKNIRDWFETLYLLKHDKNLTKHKRKRIYPTFIDFEKVIVCLIKIEQETNIDNCKKYAKHFPNNPICKPFLDVDIPRDNPEEHNNIINFESPFKKSTIETKEKKPLTLKKKMKNDILEKLKFQKLSNGNRRTTIANLYDMTMSLSSDYKEGLYHQCLRELKKKGELYFADLNPYSEIHLP